MVKEVNAETLKVVLDSWEELKKVDDYEEVAGKMIMKTLFEKCPKAKPMFGYDLLADVDEEFMSDPKFVAHSVQLIGMFGKALKMLDSDGKLLTEQIRELGTKHVTYGVRAEQFPIMGKALYTMLADKLGDAFTDDMRDSWKVVFGTIAHDLMLTVLKSSREERAKISDPAGNTEATTAA